MNRTTRVVVAFLMAIGIAMSIGDLLVAGVDHGYYHSYDVTWDVVPNVADTATVTSVEEKSAAQRQGVRVGDRLHFENLGIIERGAVQGGGGPPPHGAWQVTDQRTGTRLALLPHPYVPRSLVRRAYSYYYLSIRIFVECAALVILLLRGATVAGAGLAVFLFCDQFTYSAIEGLYLGSVWETAYQSGVQAFLLISGYAALIIVALSYTPRTRIRDRFGALAITAAGAGLAVLVFGNCYALFTGQVLPYIADASIYARFLFGLLLAAIGFFVAAIRSSHSLERRRLIILTTSLAIGALAPLQAAIGLPDLYSMSQGIVADACTLAMAIGLTYAILKHRLFDIEFVLNRAVVFTVMSAIVVTSFAIVEWLVGTYASNLLGRAQSVALQMLIALGIGLWLRRLHAGVDYFVDRWLFETRHKRAKAMLAFADEAATISTPDALLQATVKTIRTFGGASGCGVLLADEHGDYLSAAAQDATFEPIARDDLVAVRLRTSRRPLDGREFTPLTAADVAFPMTVGHELAGILLCKLPPRAEPYSPEEIDALAKTAHEVAMALVALEAREARRMRQTFALHRVT